MKQTDLILKNGVIYTMAREGDVVGIDYSPVSVEKTKKVNEAAIAEDPSRELVRPSRKSADT